MLDPIWSTTVRGREHWLIGQRGNSLSSLWDWRYACFCVLWWRSHLINAPHLQRTILITWLVFESSWRDSYVNRLKTSRTKQQAVDLDFESSHCISRNNDNGVPCAVLYMDGWAASEVYRSSNFLSRSHAKKLRWRVQFAWSSFPGGTESMGSFLYEAVFQTTATVLRQWPCVEIAGDSFGGSDFVDCLEKLVNYPNTKDIVLIGEIGGSVEREVTSFIRESGTQKPAVTFIAGKVAPPGRQMGPCRKLSCFLTWFQVYCGGVRRRN